MSKLEKGQKAYEAHVASQPYPRRYKPWYKLPESTKADFAALEAAADKKVVPEKPAKPAAEKPVEAPKKEPKKETKKVTKKKAAKKAAPKKAAAKK